MRLADVADVRIVPVPNVIEREGQSRKIDVSANVKGRDLGSVAEDVEAALEKIEFPLGYHAEVIGEFAERQAAQQQLAARRVRCSDRDLLPPVYLLWQLAPGDPDLLHPALGAGGWRAGSLFQQRRPLARFAGWVAHHPGDCHPQRHHDDQPLPASGRGGRRALWSGTGPARGDANGLRRS